MLIIKIYNNNNYNNKIKLIRENTNKQLQKKQNKIQKEEIVVDH